MVETDIAKIFLDLGYDEESVLRLDEHLSKEVGEVGFCSDTIDEQLKNRGIAIKHLQSERNRKVRIYFDLEIDSDVEDFKLLMCRKLEALPYDDAKAVYERVYLAEQKALVYGTNSNDEYDKIIEEKSDVS